MTTKDPAVRAAAAIDFTMMYATHDVFRRDLGRLKAAATAGTAQAPGVRAGWETSRPSSCCTTASKTPTCGHVSAGRPSGLALLAEMAAEHAQIDPLLAAVDDALAHSPSNLAAAVAGLASPKSAGRSGHRHTPRRPPLPAVRTNSPHDERRKRPWRKQSGAMTKRGRA